MHPASDAAPLPLRPFRALRCLVLLVVCAAALALVGGAGVLHAAATPAGRIAYVAPDGSLVVANADGSAPQPIWTAPRGETVREPRWSPDSTRLAFIGPDGNVWTVGADGSAPHPLTQQAVAPSGCGDDGCTNPGAAADTPRWSPDGTLISYRLVQGLATAAIFTVPAAGGSPTRLVSAPDLCLFNEGFTPGGVALYSRCAAASGPSNATYLAADGASRPFLAGSQIAYSLDGTMIAFSSQATSGNAIQVTLFIAQADGSEARTVAADGQNPAWSAQGLLAYQVGGTDGWSVHVFDPTDGSDRVVAQGQFGCWSADGGWLVYTVTDAEGATLWSVRADGTQAHPLAAGEAPACTS